MGLGVGEAVGPRTIVGDASVVWEASLVGGDAVVVDGLEMVRGLDDVVMPVVDGGMAGTTVLDAGCVVGGVVG